jgi:hypothetical protein
MVMAAIALVAYMPLTHNISRITGRVNKVERANILGYLGVFLVCGLATTGALFMLDWRAISSIGHASLMVLFFVGANLIAHAFYGKRAERP